MTVLQTRTMPTVTSAALHPPLLPVFAGTTGLGRPPASNRSPMSPHGTLGFHSTVAISTFFSAPVNEAILERACNLVEDESHQRHDPNPHEHHVA
jgi:hypothetical protein